MNYPISVDYEWGTLKGSHRRHLPHGDGFVRPNLGIICPDLMLSPLPGKLQQFEWIEISLEEQARYAANNCPLNQETIFVIAGNDRVNNLLAEQYGMEVIPCSIESGIALGGALRCAHHPLSRLSS
jgi:N-dimethylarginine dimethylaminohydrolase